MAQEARRRNAIAFLAVILAPFTLGASDGLPALFQWSFGLIAGLAGLSSLLAIRFLRQKLKLKNALEESERRYRELSQLSSTLILRCDGKGRCLNVNKNWEQDTGQSAEEAIGQGWLTPVHPEDRDRVAYELCQAAIDRRAATMEFRINTSNGRTLWFLGQSRLAPKHEGEDQCSVWTFTEISSRKRTEEALYNSELHYRTLFNSAPVGISLATLQGEILDCNPPLLHMLGLSPGLQFKAEDIFKLFVDKSRLEELFRLFRENACIHDFEAEILHMAGGKWWANINVSSIICENRDLLMILVEDVSPRKAAEKASHENYLLLEALLDNIPAPVFFKDTKGAYLGGNLAFASYMGRRKNEFIGKTAFELVPPNLARIYDKMDRELLKKGVKHRQIYETDLQAASGKLLHVLLHKSVFAKQDNSPGGIVGVILDITERKSMEEKLRKSEELYRELFEKMSSGFAYHEVILDSQEKPCDYRFLQVNPAFEKLTGLLARDVTGKRALEIIPGLERHWIDIYGEVAISRQPCRFERYSEPLGRHFEVFAYSPEPGRFATIFNDVSERKQAEMERNQTIALLALLNKNEDVRSFMHGILSMMREWSGCDAVGIRLQNGDDYPYYETQGFPDDFLLAENSLCSKTNTGTTALEASGKPMLEGMCGTVLQGQTDPSLSCFTENGSFWSNSSTELRAATAKMNGKKHPCHLLRGQCNRAGYESVALIPLMVGNTTYGLLQFNSRHQNIFTKEKILFFEYMAGYAAIGLSNIRNNEEIKRQRDHLDEMVALRTAELRDSMEKLSAINESCQIGVIIFQQDKVLYVNSAISAITGYSSEDLYSLNPARYLYQDCRDALAKSPGATDGTEAPFLHSEFEILCKGKERKWVDGFAKIISLGGQESLLVTLTDITARKTAEEESIRSQERLHLILQASSDGTWELDLETMLLMPQPRLLEKLGYSKHIWSHSSSNNWLLKIHPEDKSRVISEFEEHIAGKTPVLDTAFRLQRPDGDYLWLLIRATLIRAQGSARPIMLVGSAEDISEHRRHDELKEQLEFQQVLLDSLPIPVCYKDCSGRYLGCNTATLVEKGLNRDELIGKTDEELYGPELPPLSRLMKEGDAALLSSGGMSFREVTGFDTSGSKRSILLHKAIFRDKKGKPAGIIEAVVELTDLRMAEAALRESELRLNTILNAINELIFYIDEQLRIVWLNKAAAELFGIPEESAAGKSCEKLFPCKPSLSEACAKGLANTPTDVEFVAITPDRKIFKIFGYPVCNRETRIRGLVVVALEITEEQKAKEEAALRREQLMQADKLKTLGILVAGVAHEINNPTNFIMLNVPLLRDAWRNALPFLEKQHVQNPSFSMGGMPFEYIRNAVEELLDGIEEGAVRIRDIVQNLKDYAKQSSINMDATFDINKAVKSSLAILANFIKLSTDNFSVSYGKSLPHIRGDIRRIEQVIINLVQNACEALPSKKAALSVRTCFEKDSGMVAVLVEDEGKGMEEEELKHVFAPFFTTKRDKGGTGLGLSVSQTIVEEHHGILQFSSDPGYGTLARVSLPPADNDIPEKSSP